MSDTNAEERIRVLDINPLLNSGHMGFQETVYKVRAVLAVLGDMKLDDVPSDDYNYGLSLIHEWISDTLTFVSNHPDTVYLVPVSKEAQS